MTGGAIRPEAQAFIEGMGERVIEKPFVPSELRARVNEIPLASSGGSAPSDSLRDGSRFQTG
ncbi:MAG: hypothetical protein ACOC5B_00840 [Myxococcota bacterium]